MDSYVKFITHEKCTNKEFKEAYLFAKSNSLYIESKFNDVIYVIMNRCLKIMEKKGISILTTAKACYSYFGLDDGDFAKFFQDYLNSDMEILKKYKTIVDGFNSNIYEQAYNECFSNEIIVDLATTYKIPESKIKEIISTVLMKKHNVVQEEIKKIKFTLIRFLLFIKNRNETNIKEAYYYFKYYADGKEKQLFVKTILELLNNEEFLNNTKYLVLYYQIPELDKTLKNKILCLFEKYYDYCEKVNWKYSLITIKAREWNISYNDFTYMAREYAISYLKINENEITGIPKDVYIKRILKERKPDIVTRLFKDGKISLHDIDNFLYTVNNFTVEQKQEYEAILLKKFEYYKSTLNQTTKANSSPIVKKIPTIIQEFLDSDMTISEFCEQKNITIKAMKDKIRSCPDKDLLEQLNLELQKEAQAEHQKQINQTNKLLTYLYEGITENGITRDFDLLDFFLNFQDTMTKNYLIPELNVEERKMLRIFFGPIIPFNGEILCFNTSIIHNGYCECNVTLENGEVTKRTLGEADLQIIYDFFITHNIPRYNYLLNIAIKRYANNTLFNKEDLQTSSLSLQ